MQGISTHCSLTLASVWQHFENSSAESSGQLLQVQTLSSSWSSCTKSSVESPGCSLSGCDATGSSLNIRSESKLYKRNELIIPHPGVVPRWEDPHQTLPGRPGGHGWAYTRAIIGFTSPQADYSQLIFFGGNKQLTGLVHI